LPQSHALSGSAGHLRPGAGTSLVAIYCSSRRLAQREARVLRPVRPRPTSPAGLSGEADADVGGNGAVLPDEDRVEAGSGDLGMSSTMTPTRCSSSAKAATSSGGGLAVPGEQPAGPRRAEHLIDVGIGQAPSCGRAALRCSRSRAEPVVLARGTQALPLMPVN
jgi:hypothetical protein